MDKFLDSLPLTEVNALDKLSTSKLFWAGKGPMKAGERVSGDTGQETKNAATFDAERVRKLLMIKDLIC